MADRLSKSNSKQSKVPGRKLSLTVQGKAAGRKKSIQNGTQSKKIGSAKQVLPKIKKMTERFDDMITGCLDNLPPKPPSEVRIFLSSTFSDMRAERNALAKNSYPAIKDYCYSYLDLDFQVVDLRWGINNQATNNHVTEKICLMEIENCQKVSLGPNFVAVLSHRYGYRSIPPEINSDEFDVIMNEVKELNLKDSDKLTTWYLKDEDNIPPVHVLQPINSIIQSFGDADGEKAKKAQEAWNTECNRIQTMLRQGVKSAYKKGLLSTESQHKYFRSVTEEEVEKGILLAPDPGSHAACFIRRLSGVNQDRLLEKNATRYIDTVQCDGVLTVDEEVNGLIREVQENKIPKKLPKGNIHVYDVSWQDGGISPDTYETHKQYIEELCRDFTHEMISLIEAEKHLKQDQIPTSEYYTEFDELLHHLYFCKSKCENFKGRQDILDNVQKYLNDKKNRKPLVLFAESGAGKTSVMAMIMKRLPKWFGPDCVRLIRFLGTSPESSDIFDVLFGVMGQLADEFDMILEPVGYKNIKSLIKYLPRFLRNVSRASKEHVFILLDSIDQLNSTNNAHSMNWLPTELPANIHIILSMLPDRYGCLDKTLSVLNKEKKCFLELKSLPMETGTEIIDEYLRKHNRKMKDKMLILDDLKKDPKPLFLKLLLDRAMEWRSYETKHKPLDNVHHAIETLFTNIEEQCGQCATRAAIGYLTHGLNGLTEVEIEDVLSLDDDVLDSVYVYHDPPIDGVIHIPSIVLKRILYMLREYIVERRSQGKKTIYWYHRQFIEYATDYVKHDEVKLHKRLADLYLAEEPIKRTITLSSRRKTLKDFDRQITVQQLTARNKRKLQALPYHLRKSGNLTELKKHCLCKLKFMMCKIKAFSLSVLLKDYLSGDPEINSDPDPEINLVLGCLKDMKDSVNNSNLALELLCRLPESSEKMTHVNNLLASCREQLRNEEGASLMPLYPCLGNMSQQHVTISNVEQILGISSDQNVFILECTEAGLREKRSWKILNCSSSKMQMIEKSKLIFAPVLSKDGDVVLLFEQIAGKSDVRVDVLNMDTLENVNNFEISLGTKSSLVKCIEVKDEYLTLAFEDFEIKTFSLMRKKSEVKGRESSGKRARETCSFFLDLDRSENLKLSSVFRIGLSKVLVHYVSVVICQDECTFRGDERSRNDDDSCVKGCIVITAVTATEQRQLCAIYLSDSILSDNIQFLSSEGIHKILLVPTFTASDNVYKVRRYDIQTGEALQELTFNDVIEQGHSLSKIILGPSMAVPQLEQTKWSLKLVSFESDGKSENTRIACVGYPVCTFVTKDGEVAYSDRKGRLYLCQIKTDHNHGIEYKTCKLTGDRSIQNIYINEDTSMLTILAGNKTLMIWSWNDVKDNLSDTDVQAMISEEKVERRMECDPEDLEHLGHHEGVLSVLISRDEVEIWTLDRDCQIRSWKLDSCSLSQTVAVLKDDMLLEFGELQGSVHCSDSEISFYTAYFSELKELTMFCRGPSKKSETLQYTYNNITAYYLDITKEDLEKSKLYILSECSENKYKIDIYNWPFSSREKNVNIKDPFTGSSIQMKPTVTRHHLVLAVECTELEREIIIETVNRNHLKHHGGTTRFYSIDLKKGSAELSICHRQLTKIPCLANCWEMYSEDLVALGFGRIVVLWDTDSGSCDQRMIKGSKTAMIYRPGWTEDEANHMKICHGKTTCMQLSGQGNLLGVGSEDGYVMAYSVPRGNSVVERVGKKPNHGHAVEYIAVSGDGNWMASYCCKKILKLWHVVDSMKECSRIELGLSITRLAFSESSKYLVFSGTRTTGESKVYVFCVLSPEK